MMDELAAQVHATAREKGFWDHEYIVFTDPVLGDVEGRKTNPSIRAEKIALIHSEASEALEALRDGDNAHVGEELADILIRVLDLAHHMGLSMDHEVAVKMKKNAERPHLHGRVW